MNPFLKNILKSILFQSGWLMLIWIHTDAQELSNLNPESVAYYDTLVLPDVYQSNLKSATGEKLLDSVYFFDPDTGISAWKQTQSTLYRYDIENLPSDEISRYWSVQDSQWKEFLKKETSWFPSGIKKEEITRAWDSENEIWENRMRNSYRYDSLNQLKYQITSYWKTDSQMWKDSLRYSYGFDEDGNWIMYSRETWLPDSLFWMSNYRFIISYENGIKTKLLRQNYRSYSQIWVNSNKIIYTYDLQNRLIAETGNVWDADSSKWDPNSRIKYLYYDNGKLSDKIYKSWKPEGWSHYARYNYSWDEPGNNTNIIYSTWDTAMNLWEENAAYQYEYDEDGDLIREIWKDFNPQISEWLSTFRIDYYFNLTTFKEEAGLAGIQVFPNPFSESLTISFESDYSSNHKPVWVRITDIKGRILYTMPSRYSQTRLTGLNLPTGIYFLIITNGKQIFSRKIVRE